jgi:hypothetical protein
MNCEHCSGDMQKSETALRTTLIQFCLHDWAQVVHWHDVSAVNAKDKKKKKNIL